MRRSLIPPSLLLLSTGLTALSLPTARGGGDPDNARVGASHGEAVEVSGVEADRMLALAQCGACHALPEAANGMAVVQRAPDLSRVGERLDPASLRAYLNAPHTVRPRTRMPDLLAGLPDSERDETLDRLVRFLSGDQAAYGAAPAPGPAIDLVTVEKGRQLFHSAGCVACHGAFDDVEALEMTLAEFEDPLAAPQDPDRMRTFAPADVWEDAPPLDRLGPLYSHAQLKAFLQDPLASRPYGAMPDLKLSEEEADQLATYLLFEDAVRGGNVTESTVSGLVYQYFEGDFHEEGPPAFDRLESVRQGHVTDLSQLPAHRGNNFGLRYLGIVDVPADGTWTFATTSDDGSWLWIDGAPVVANGGTHPPQERRGTIELTAGPHEIEVRYFEIGGGESLVVSWEGPGVAFETIPEEALSSVGLTFRRELPAAPPTRVEPRRHETLRAEGARAFQELGCVACHPMEGLAVPEPVSELLDLRAAIEAGAGCLSSEPARGVPHYPEALVASDGPLRGAARAALDGALALDEAALVDSELSTMRCTACHSREGVGEPTEERRKHFRIADDVDLGDEGRVPPGLDLVGWKLRDEWLARVLEDGAEVRPYMLTRMPRFGPGNVSDLIERLPRVDRPAEEAVAPTFSKEAVESGQLLLGIDGLGCVQCHDLAGYEGLGVPAVDLATSHERLRWPWFRALLADPGALNMNTRMPAFWTEDGRSPVEELYGADPVRQVEAMWSFLSLGDAAPLPKGLVIPEGAYELTPLEEPLAVSVFWEGASARTTLVGYPERLHVAFDVENSRLDAAWRGRFFDARGTWHARAGALERPPTDDVLRLPAGPAFARLDGDGTAWPTAAGRATDWRVHGRRYDAERRPIFLYGNEGLGGLLVEEQPQPVLEEDGVWLTRAFRLRAEAPPTDLWMRAAVGANVTATADGSFVTDAGVRVRVEGAETRIRSTDASQELLVAVPWGGGDEATFSLSINWTRNTEASR